MGLSLLTLDKFGFNTKSVNCIKAIYNTPTAHAKVNGSLSERFQLERGTRQGCCLSPTLFALYIEPLAQMIRKDSTITGINIDGNEHVISLFADDVLIYPNYPVNTFSHLMKILEWFGLHSGYKLNLHKTQVLMFNCSPTQKLKEFNIKLEAKIITYLGIKIPKTLATLYTRNYETINQHI